jgi:hypothetical protein
VTRETPATVRGQLDTTMTPHHVHRPLHVRPINITHLRSILRMSNHYRGSQLISRPSDDFALLADIIESPRYSLRHLDILRMTPRSSSRPLNIPRDPPIFVATTSRPLKDCRKIVATLCGPLGRTSRSLGSFLASLTTLGQYSAPLTLVRQPVLYGLHWDTG